MLRELIVTSIHIAYLEVALAAYERRRGIITELFRNDIYTKPPIKYIKVP